MAQKKQKTSAPSAKSAAKKGEFAPEGKRLEDVKLKKGEEIPKPRLEEFYRENVVPALMKKFEYKSIMQVPKLEKFRLIWAWARLHRISNCFSLPLMSLN